MNGFQKLELSNSILKDISSLGYSTPTPIQKKAIPIIKKRKDLIANAATGTGKSAAYLLPIIDNISLYKFKNHKINTVAIILAPTRELVVQIKKSIDAYSISSNIKSIAIYGGASYEIQIQKLESNRYHIIVATPGRALDMIAKSHISLSKINQVVIDEADRMFDMGFILEIKQLLSIIPPKRQIMLFSATFSKKVKEFVATFLNNPSVIDIAREKNAKQKITQRVHHIDCDRKLELLSYMIGSMQMEHVLVFTRTKASADEVHKELIASGLKSTIIHKDIKQSSRNRALSEFKEKRVQVLVATDIAARGLNIDNLPYVLNYELPVLPEDYIHRIGRTGRAGKSGEAISLLCYEELNLFNKIENLIKIKVPKFTLKGFELTKSFRDKIIKKKRKSKERFIKAKISKRDMLLKQKNTQKKRW